MTVKVCLADVNYFVGYRLAILLSEAILMKQQCLNSRYHFSFFFNISFLVDTDSFQAEVYISESKVLMI